MSLLEKLKELLNAPGESQVLEFKQAGSDFSKEKLGEYISALSNEAGLKDLPEAWLLLGIRDNRSVCGTSFLATHDKWNQALNYLSEHLSNNQHPEIDDITHEGKRVLMVRVAPPTVGTVMGFKRQYYARDGESLVGLHPEKHQRLLTKNTDWSAVVIEGASIEDLEPQAIEEAKKQFKIRHPQLAVDTWNTRTFLNKAHLTIEGKVTRTALLLLGKSESTHFLQPADPFIRWRRFDGNGNRIDQGRFGIPFLLTTPDIAQRIQNPLIRHIPVGKLFEEELERYQPYSIREALHNCIAHQEYRRGSLVDVTEYHDRLVFANQGNFIPCSVELMVEQDSPPPYYRNKHLANAMANLRMVDTMGGGIRRLFEGQKDRGFPLPDYDLTNNQVKVTLMGQVMDIRFQKVLAKNPELSLKEVMLLDKVQKQKP
ncbi:MAG: RNA-binding domain-containing protein, partial [Vampirovibrionales bacterium]